MLHSRRAEILFTRNWQLLYTFTKMNPCHWGTYQPFLNPSCSLLHGGCLFFLSPWIISRMLWYRNFAGNWQEHYPTLGLYSLRLPFLSWTYVFHSVRISSMTKPIYKISEEAHKMHVCSSLLSNETPLQLSQLISPLWSLQSLRYSL